MPVDTPNLDKVASPADLSGLTPENLTKIADEVRAEVIDTVSVTGGHLGSALGVVELTVGLHAVFDTPEDKLIFDVGHQCYPHKILTGRRDRIRTLRKGGGCPGSPNVPRVNMIHLAQHMPQRQSRPDLALSKRGICKAKTIM